MQPLLLLQWRFIYNEQMFLFRICCTKFKTVQTNRTVLPAHLLIAIVRFFNYMGANGLLHPEIYKSKCVRNVQWFQNVWKYKHTLILLRLRSQWHILNWPKTRNEKPIQFIQMAKWTIVIIERRELFEWALKPISIGSI